MYAMERQERIEQILSDEQRVTVHDLAARFDVTTETVRRDLDALDRAGALRRVHGGAVQVDRASTAEPTVDERTRRRSKAKAAIAARALEVIPDGFRGSVYLDAGTTTAAVADLLPARLTSIGGHADVITHSLTLAPGLATAPGVQLTVVGGRVRGVTAAAVGSDTVTAIETLRPDIVFLGVNGISAGFGCSTPDPDEAAVKTAIVHAARRLVVVADATKFGAESLVRVATLDEVDVLVTDAAPTGALADALATADTEVWTA